MQPKFFETVCTQIHTMREQVEMSKDYQSDLRDGSRTVKAKKKKQSGKSFQSKMKQGKGDGIYATDCMGHRPWEKQGLKKAYHLPLQNTGASQDGTRHGVLATELQL